MQYLQINRHFEFTTLLEKGIWRQISLWNKYPHAQNISLKWIHIFTRWFHIKRGARVPEPREVYKIKYICGQLPHDATTLDHSAKTIC